MYSTYLNELIDFLKTTLSINYQAINSLPNEVTEIFLSEQRVSLYFHNITKHQSPKTENEQVHIWLDQWQTKPNIVKARLTSLTGKSKRLHGRKTLVKRIDSPLASTFLNEHHLVGATNSKFKYGLFYNEDLVAVATFSAARNFGDKKSYELIRFCTKSGVSVTGGLSKLLQAFIKERNPDEIMTYIDLDWSRGLSFEALGFKETGQLEANRYFINKNLERSINPIPKETLLGYAHNSGSRKLKWYAK